LRGRQTKLGDDDGVGVLEGLDDGFWEDVDDVLVVVVFLFPDLLFDPL